MCRGNSEHHRQEEIRRAGGIAAAQAHQAELDRRAEQDALNRMRADAERRQQEALQMIASSSKQPYQVKTQADAGTPLMRTRQKSADARRGIADLRIARTPGINAGSGNSGTNVG